jgi:hypothetical protein
LKNVSLDRELILPEFKDPKSLSVQLVTVRLNGVSTHSLVEIWFRWCSSFPKMFNNFGMTMIISNCI